MKNCPYCGAEIYEHAILCVHCKASLAPVEQAAASSNEKICPNCGNVCIKDAVICVKCGQSFQAAPANTVKSTASTASKNGGAKVIGVVAIVLAVLGVIGGITTFINYMSFGGVYIIQGILTLVSCILLLVGFIRRKNNPIPGIAFLITAASTLIFLIAGRSNVFFAIASIIESVLVALLFLNKKTNGRKIWFVPAGLTALVTIISLVVNLVEGVYEIDYYYYSYFDWESFLIRLFMNLTSVIGTVVYCLNAKFNWFVDATTPVENIPAPSNVIAEPVANQIEE